MGTPIYPKDAGTEWMNLKRQVKDAWTSANSRVAYQKIGAGVLKVFQSLEVQAGAFIKYVFTGGVTGMLMGRHLSGSDPVDGIFIARPDGSTALWIHSRVSDGYGFTALYDQQNNIIFSDDGNSEKGIGRPWLAFPFVNTTEIANPPSARQTSGTTDVAVVTMFVPIQHPYIHFVYYGSIFVGGSTMEVKFKNITTGVTMHSETVGDGWQSGEFSIGDYNFGESHQIDVTIRRASGSGAVGITVLTLAGRQSP